jgi:hypothetical protein
MLTDNANKLAGGQKVAGSNPVVPTIVAYSWHTAGKKKNPGGPGLEK